MLGPLIQISQSLHKRADQPRSAGTDKPDHVLIGHALGGDARAAERCLLAWSRAQGADSTHASGFLWLIQMGILLVGAFLGGGLAGALLAYSGERPVNVLPLLVVFVLLPLVLSLLFIVGIVTQRWWPRLPVLGDLSTVWSTTRMMVARRWLERSLKVELSGPGIDRVWSPIAGWLGARWSLGLGLGFQSGGLVVLIGAVTLSDLAFGWATTLEVSNERVAQWVQASAEPWVWAWPPATVDYELIERSRVYRLPGDTTGVESGTREEGVILGGWWRYLLMAMLVYGLIPRLLTYGYAGWRVRHEARSAVLSLDGARDVLLGMLESPLPLGDGRSEGAVEAQGLARLDRQPAAVLWSEPGDCSQSWKSWVDDGWSGPSGSLNDLTILTQLTGSDHGDVLVIVPGWEPPMGDRLDDLSALRQRLGNRNQRIVVVLASPDSRALAEEEISDWRRCLLERGDHAMALSIAPVEEPRDA